MNAARRLAVVAAILLVMSGAAAAATNAEQYNTRTFLDRLGGLFSLTSCETTAQLRSTGFDVNADTVDAQIDVAHDTFCDNDKEQIGASVELYVVDENGNWLRSRDIVCEDVIAPDDGDYEGGNTVIKFSDDVCKINTPAASELDDGHEVMLGFYATTVGHVDDAEQVPTGIVGGQQDETTDSDTTTSSGSSDSTTSTSSGSEQPDLSYQFDTSVDGRTVTTDFTITNSGGSMAEAWIVEQQIKTEAGSFLSLSTLSGPKTCDPSHPENVHKEFRVDAGDAVQGTLTSEVPESVGGGTFLVKTIVTTKCGAGFVKEQWRLGMVTLEAPTGETVPSTDVEASENGTVDLSKVLGRDVPKTVWVVEQDAERCTTVAGVQAKADGKKWFRSQENCRAALDDGIIESKTQLVGIGIAGLAGLTVATAVGGFVAWRFV